jgi:hypothetical protein
MPRARVIRPMPKSQPIQAGSTSGSWCSDRSIHLYGWDSRNQIWHGPNEVGSRSTDKRLVKTLSAAVSSSWYGPITCCTAGEPSSRFFALIHDISDCAVASIYCDESKTGPVEILAVIPGGRRARLREDFALEFIGFSRFLGSLNAGTELQVYQGIEAALANEKGSCACVFSISSGLLHAAFEPALACCAEKVALALCEWLSDAGPRSTRGSAPAA